MRIPFWIYVLNYIIIMHFCKAVRYHALLRLNLRKNVELSTFVKYCQKVIYMLF